MERIERKDYVFIIDEINRGEASKIFGELFYAIDPGYRGKRMLELRLNIKILFLREIFLQKDFTSRIISIFLQQ